MYLLGKTNSYICSYIHGNTHSYIYRKVFGDLHYTTFTENHLNLGPPAVTTNIEQYLDRITDCYSQGFLLAKFVRVPSVKMTTEPADWTSPQLYQAILSKPASV